MGYRVPLWYNDFRSRKGHRNDNAKGRLKMADVNEIRNTPGKSANECGMCHRTFSSADMHEGYCKECWPNELRFRRLFYRVYHMRLETELKKLGISVEKVSDKLADENGIPKKEVSKIQRFKMQELKGSEKAMFTLTCRGTLFAFPDNAEGIRYIKISGDKEERDWAEGVDCRERLVAALTDGREIYFLTQTGMILSTDTAFEPVKAFEQRDEVRNVCRYTKSGYAESYAQSITKRTNFENFAYDPVEKKFYTKGDDPVQITKNEALDTIYSPGFYELYLNCVNGGVPVFSVVDLLEEE